MHGHAAVLWECYKVLKGKMEAHWKQEGDWKEKFEEWKLELDEQETGVEV